MSKKAVLLLAAIMLLTSGFQLPKRKRVQPKKTGSTSKSTAWIVFAPEGGGFSVMLPGNPTQTSVRTDSATEPVTSPAYQLESGAFKYVITYMDYPYSIEGTQARDKLLEMAAEKGIAEAGGRVVSNTPISLGDYPGREVRAEIVGFFSQTRVYLVKQRLYVLIVWMRADKTASENATKFFESFKLLPDSDGSENLSHE